MPIAPRSTGPNAPTTRRRSSPGTYRLAVIGACLFLTACGSDPPVHKPAAPQPQPPAETTESSGPDQPAATPDAPPGALTGHIRFDGTAPVPRTLKVTSDQSACGQHSLLSEELRVSDAMGLAGVVAVLEGPGLDAPHEEAPAELPMLDQKGCQFTPHILIVRTGIPFVIRNSDSVLHNARSTEVPGGPLADSPPNRSFNLAMPREGQELKKRLKSSGIVEVACDVHAWMKSYVVAVPHHFARVSDREGRFQMDDIPAGRYTLHLWHETLGTRQETVVVAPADTVEVTLAWSPD